MSVGSRVFWLPRRGNSPDQYEDASALDDASGRYALADGATEGCFTGLWARLLVEDFVSRAVWEKGTGPICAKHPEGRSGKLDLSPFPADRWVASLSAVQERWDADVRGRKLDWDADYWIERGAFAAFLGVVLTSSPRLPGDGRGQQVSPLPPGEGQGVRGAPCHWQAVAVGDTCLFHTRGGVLLRAFPLDRSDQFGNRPQLVGSRMAADAVGKRQRLWSDGRGEAGDRLWAMTDALAKWCLVEHEAGNDPWNDLESLAQAATNLPSPCERGAGETDLPSPSGRGAGGEGALQREAADTRFALWIDGLRDAGRLLNDDVTLLAIHL